MTTIAWDGKALAADSRMTCEGVITTDNFVKICELNSPHLDDTLLAVGLAGAVSDHVIIYNLLVHNQLYDYQKDHQVNALIVGKNHLYELEPGSNSLIFFNKKIKIAIGTGANFALSAMGLGLNSKDAIKHAIKYDCFSGGKVRTWEDSK